MKPALRHFFESMAAYLAEPEEAGLERLYKEYPGWEAPRSRVALYGGFVRHHVVSGVDKLYPLVRRCVGESAWEELVRRYVETRPARHFEPNRLGESFPAFLADLVPVLGLAPWVPALARFEWADFAVYISQEQVPRQVARLAPNPTLAVLQHPWRLCAFIRGGLHGEPQAGEEMMLLWRHPRELVTLYSVADDSSLLALKMAVEGLEPASVAAATGVAEEDIVTALRRCVEDGLVLSP